MVDADMVSRMPPGVVVDADIHQGWALGQHEPDGGPGRGADLLFLHGMASGGWMWSADWLARFTQAGFRCWTMTLPGREGGQTLASDPAALDRALSLALSGAPSRSVLDAVIGALPGASLFDGPDLDDFTDALADAVNRVGRPVVVVAHSLGGAVVQNLLRRGDPAPAGTILMCSAPPYGMWRSTMQMSVVNRPLWRALLDFSLFGKAGADVETIRANLFPEGIADRDFAEMMAQMRDESLPAMLRANGFPPFAPPPGRRHDMLVMGAARDRLVPAWDVQMTGLYYGCGARILPNAGHMPMRGAAAGPASRTILDWLDIKAPALRAA